MSYTAFVTWNNINFQYGINEQIHHNKKGLTVYNVFFLIFTQTLYTVVILFTFVTIVVKLPMRQVL